MTSPTRSDSAGHSLDIRLPTLTELQRPDSPVRAFSFSTDLIRAWGPPVPASLADTCASREDDREVSSRYDGAATQRTVSVAHAEPPTAALHRTQPTSPSNARDPAKSIRNRDAARRSRERRKAIQPRLRAEIADLQKRCIEAAARIAASEAELLSLSSEAR